MKLHTTLNQIRSHNPCSNGWGKLLQHLGKTKQDDEPLSFATILESNGFDDTLWCLRTVAGYDREIRLYAVWCARQVEHLDPSGVAKKTNDVSERYAKGEATEDELEAARAAARGMGKELVAMATSWGDEELVALGALGVARAAARAARAAGVAGETAMAAWVAGETAMAAAWAAREAGAAVEAQKQEFIKRFCTE